MRAISWLRSVGPRSSLLCSVLAAILAVAVQPAFAIEAVRGKTYKLSKQHGPWIIMVATFRDIPAEERAKEGLTARQAADELIFELREQGIPAYVYEQDGKIEKIATKDRLGRPDDRIYAAQRDMISVLAGNYPDIEDKTAQKTLAFVKKYQPKFMKDGKSGAVYNQLTAKSGPLHGAFLTINPMINPEELAKKKADTGLLKGNSGLEYPLIAVKKKYTLQIATFTGRSAIPMGNSAFRGKESRFDSLILDKSRMAMGGINRAGEDAEQLTLALRQHKFEAYTFHDHYESIVTVGAFDDEKDPDIRRGFEIFSARMKTDPTTGQEVLVSEILTLPGENPGDPPLASWIFDPQPKLIPVPRIK